MQNHMRNTMQFIKRLCDEGLRTYGRFCAQGQSKTQKRIENEKIFTVLSVHEEGKSPCTLRWLGPSKLEFYGEYNGS